MVHQRLTILQVLAAYTPHAPKISMALGDAIRVVGPGGNVLRSVTVFPEFVRKSVDLSQQHGSVMGYPELAEMYRALGGGVRCPNLVRLHGGCGGASGACGGGGGIRLQPDGMTLVLHLEPVGLPLGGAPASEADLRRAVRDVLAGLAVLHAAGYVHRDIRWQNVIRLPAASASAASQQPPSSATSSSSSPSSLGGGGAYVLIDLEHAGINKH
ncbi:hypothetical protein HXX76_014288 [Chlamydomonas incerta]|uniref:Protein kinase domain-containing protein n=1 Tax=Chlamydomonas incerta TaxID=51695 RepID=A0A835SH24_CHLIN|nr:hypothetical protein HXX76_014288 [Chlamydomonas incerta]|eukprot:KAG2424712.1 hypothetical protein HXX76_014288 [Chlamydomonas incerta]